MGQCICWLDGGGTIFEKWCGHWAKKSDKLLWNNALQIDNITQNALEKSRKISKQKGKSHCVYSHFASLDNHDKRCYILKIFGDFDRYFNK